MAKLDTSGIRIAKKTVARWFCGSEARRFLPLVGRGIPVDRAEELAIAAAAEPFIAERYERLNGQLWLCLMLMVAVPIVHQVYGPRIFGAASPSMGVAAIASFTVGGLSMLFAAWRYERSLLDLRDAVALALREKTAGGPVPLVIPDKGQPDIRKLTLAAFALTGLFLLWPLADVLWTRSGGGAGWTIGAAAGLIAGIVIGIAGFAAVWSLWLGRRSAPSEDGPR